jgi:hypothetical protein
MLIVYFSRIHLTTYTTEYDTVMCARFAPVFLTAASALDAHFALYNINVIHAMY